MNADQRRWSHPSYYRFQNNSFGAKSFLEVLNDVSKKIRESGAWEKQHDQNVVYVSYTDEMLRKVAKCSPGMASFYEKVAEDYKGIFDEKMKNTPQRARPTTPRPDTEETRREDAEADLALAQELAETDPLEGIW